jgi:hypothetical protein
MGVDPVLGGGANPQFVWLTQDAAPTLAPPTLLKPPETERRSSSPISPDGFALFLLLSGLEFGDGLDFWIGMKTSSQSLWMTQGIHGG